MSDNVRRFERGKRKRVKCKKEVKEKLEKIVDVGEKTLHRGRKIMVVIIIPILQILANVIALMDDRDDYNDYM